jgi:hypothetical protein
MDRMDAPSKCTIVRAIGRSAYSSKQKLKAKHTKETQSKSLYIIRKSQSMSVKPYVSISNPVVPSADPVVDNDKRESTN